MLLCVIYVDFHVNIVGLVLTSEKAFTKEKLIKYFSVKEFSYLFDHEPVLLSLMVSEVTESEMDGKISDPNVSVKFY